MEIARMNYYFTGVLVVLFVLLCFIKPAHSRNEYLNNGTNTCSTGDLSVSVNKEIQKTVTGILIPIIIILVLLMIGR